LICYVYRTCKLSVIIEALIVDDTSAERRIFCAIQYEGGEKIMKKTLIGGLFTILLTFFAAVPARADSSVFVYTLEPSWDAIGGGGIYSAYYGPPDYLAVSPGTTTVYNGRSAGLIKAGFGPFPGNIDNWDEGLFAFQPNIRIDKFADKDLTYDVVNQYGENPVWMTIEIDTGIIGDRSDNTVYQFVPTSNPVGWHKVNAAEGKWQKWADNNGTVTGPLMTLKEVATANTGLNVVRTYLRLGMGDSYHGVAGLGTVAWIDKTEIGGITYDFVVNNGFPTAKEQCKKDGWKIFSNPTFKNQGQCEKYVENDKKDDRKCTKGWNISGDWNFELVSTKWPGTYPKTMTVSQDVSGNLSGSGKNAPLGNTWTVTGKIVGTNVNFTLTYDAPMTGYVATFVGNINSTDGTMQGTWSDVAYGDSGPWHTTLGKAVLGKCEDKNKDKDKENEQEGRKHNNRGQENRD
jgi:hypothetical protein